MILSHAVRHADVEPGSANTNVPLARPANARDCSDEVPISSKEIARNSSPNPGMVLSSSGSNASGVESRPVNPVPPVDEDAVDVVVGDPLRHQRAQPVAVVRQQRALAQAMAGFGQRGDQVIAGTVVGGRARVRHRQHAQAQRDEVAIGCMPPV